jgi:DNA-binding winged helix-turn-helix (wHTH) protein/TolB-like protein/tetratricopeptide (TPR) repeat protein
MATVRLGSIEFDPARNVIGNGSASWSVEPKIMDLLVLLAANPGEVMSRDALIENVWKVEYGSDESLTRAISVLRKTFREAGETAEIIETIPKRGYRLVVPPTPAAPDAGVAPGRTAEAGSGASPASASPAADPPAVAKPSRRPVWTYVLAAVAVLALGAWAASAFLLPRHAVEPRLMTLAVLPFENLSAQADDAVFATGVARGMRNSLSEMAGLRVLSDVSTFAVADDGMSAQEIGKTLSADWILDGGFTRSGDTIELTAELVDTRNGANFWTGHESGPATDLGRLQQLLLSRIVEAMLPRVDRGAPLPPSRPQDPRIYPLLREADELTSLNDVPGDRAETLTRGDKAWGLIQQALAIEPENSDALLALAFMTRRPVTTEQFDSPEPNLQRQMRAAALMRRALASNPNNAEAMTALAEHYRRYEWRWADAAALFEKSLQVDGNQLFLRYQYSFFFLTIGNCVASLEQAEAALLLAPNLQGPRRAITRPLRCLGRHKDSHAILMGLLDEQPSNLFVMSEAYFSLLLIRDTGEMRRMADKVEGDLFKGSPPPQVAAMTNRIRLAADMLEGRRTDEFLALVRADVNQMMGPDAPPIVYDRLGNDILWTLAIELAWAGDAEGAARALATSIASGSLYIPDTMPYGQFEFPAAVRALPQYKSAWTEDERLVELTRIRLENLKKRRMVGRLPDGALVTPAP